MTSREYAELLEYVSERSNELNNITLFKVFSTFDPKTNEIIKVTLKVNYTKDGTPLPNINGKLTKAIRKNLVIRTEQFRGDSCTKETVKNWIDDLMEVKKSQQL